MGSDPKGDAVAYRSVLAAWTDYLEHDNDGRPVVFIGHSQGAAMLIRLLQAHVDDNPAVLGKMVSAIILGGNVSVPAGRDVGGTFAHIPACTTASQTGCVIAYSSFSSPPPADSLFGRPGRGVSLQSGQTVRRGLEVLCVNPASFTSGAAPLDPYFDLTGTADAAKVTTPWVTFPGLYSGECESAGGATWLQVTDVAAPGDHRPVVTATLGPDWGLHLFDVSLALGNLTGDVAQEEVTYEMAHP